MSSCSSCKRRTTSFCFVHKAALCDDCTVSPVKVVPCRANCAIGNYFSWIADGAYEWPPRCAACQRSVPSDAQLVTRLVCKCLYHRSCALDSLSKQLTQHRGDSAALLCLACNQPVYRPATQLRSKLRESVAAIVQQAKTHTPGTAPLPTDDNKAPAAATAAADAGASKSSSGSTSGSGGSSSGSSGSTTAASAATGLGRSSAVLDESSGYVMVTRPPSSASTTPPGGIAATDSQPAATKSTSTASAATPARPSHNAASGSSTCVPAVSVSSAAAPAAAASSSSASLLYPTAVPTKRSALGISNTDVGADSDASDAVSVGIHASADAQSVSPILGEDRIDTSKARRRWYARFAQNADGRWCRCRRERLVLLLMVAACVAALPLYVYFISQTSGVTL